MIDLHGKSILITGGCSGMGRATALRAAEAGANVTIGDINIDNAAALADEIAALGCRAHIVRADISDEAEVKHLVSSAVRTFGRLDGAFNNAAVSGAGVPMHEISAEQFEKTVAINLLGLFLCMKHEIVAMREGAGGSIVNNSAAGSIAGVPNTGDYIASKGGVNGLTRIAAIEYAPHNIRVNAVLPGVIDTPMAMRALSGAPEAQSYLLAKQSIGRLGRPHEVGSAVIFLLSDLASFITGALVPVDGGFTA